MEGATRAAPAQPPEITLRRFDLSDVDDLLSWMGDDRVSHNTHWHTCTTPEEALEYLRNTILPHPWYRAICVDGKPVGYVSARPRSGTKVCRAKTSCSIAQEYWGREMAPAAVRAAVTEVFREFPAVERLEALVAAGNAGAQKVLEKAGFQREGVHSKFYVRMGKVWDMVRYALIRADPKL